MRDLDNSQDSALCAVCAARLAGQLQLGWLSLAMTLAALIAAIHSGFTPWLAMAAILGLAERYVAARLAIDAHLFGQLARGMRLEGMDLALGVLKMLPPNHPDRTLVQRTAGAMAWTRGHTALVVAQSAALAISLGANR